MTILLIYIPSDECSIIYCNFTTCDNFMYQTVVKHKNNRGPRSFLCYKTGYNHLVPRKFLNAYNKK
jgi:hypothetical protein